MKRRTITAKLQEPPKIVLCDDSPFRLREMGTPNWSHERMKFDTLLIYLFFCLRIYIKFKHS